MKSLIDDLNVRLARLEADLEIVKCRQLITDFRVDGLRALENCLQQQTQLQQLQQQQQQQQQQPQVQQGPQDLLEGAAALPPGSPPPPYRPPAPVGVAWPSEGQQRLELNRRRDALELEVARIRRPPTPPRPRLPEFAPEVPGLLPPTPWPRRNRLRGNIFWLRVLRLKGLVIVKPY